ncbi:MAG: hypothetical protein E5V52_15130 [Mesorhizobium sp.]|nr:MAG: hypothetical protein E5V52_15130 [Mesorhizobium sp.]
MAFEAIAAQDQACETRGRHSSPYRRVEEDSWGTTGNQLSGSRLSRLIRSLRKQPGQMTFVKLLHGLQLSKEFNRSGRGQLVSL